MDEKKRTSEISNVHWHTLEPHLSRDAILVVCSTLDLEAVAMKIAEDNMSCIQAWINEGKLSKPQSHQLDSWNKDRLKEFSCSIVQPFVLIQDLKPNC